MASRTKRQITIERHSITRIRISGKSRFVFCEFCQSETLAFTPEQIASYFSTDVESIYQKINDRDFHTVKLAESDLICGNSLG